MSLAEFAAIPERFISVLQVCTMLLALMCVYVLVKVVSISKSGWHCAVAALNFTVSLTVYFRSQKLYTEHIQTAVYFIAVPIIIIIMLLELMWTIRTHKRTISPMSIKEGFDRMNIGICWSFENGLPKLINHRMNQICLSITGDSLTDAKTFWETLSSSGYDTSVRGGDEPIVSTPDGKAYCFRRRKADFHGETVFELTAADITEEFNITHELEEKNKQVIKINNRLKALNATINYMIMERETLQLKVRLHDNLGQALLMGRRFAADKDSVDKEKLITLWKNNLMLLKNEHREKWQRSYHVSCERAGLLGVELVINGQLPQEEWLVPVVDTAIIVHTTNVMRHAEGTHAFISVSKDTDNYILRFTNDGIPPSATINETGGLANLRRQTKQAGGTMQVNSSPVFELILTLPIRRQSPLAPFRLKNLST